MSGYECSDVDIGIDLKSFDYLKQLLRGVDQIIIGEKDNVGRAAIDSIVAVDGGSAALDAGDSDVGAQERVGQGGAAGALP